MPATTAAVHLVWAPLGPAPLDEFLTSYRRHPAGADHDLVVLLNGLPAEPAERAAARVDLLGRLDGVQHSVIELERPVLDLAAYGVAARRLSHQRLCILNSYSVLLADDWLALLHSAESGTAPALVGATGSWESQADWRRNRPLHRAYDLLRLPGLRRDFPPFPNPHLRSNGLLVGRELLLRLGLESVSDKRTAYRLESGRESFSRRVEAEGGRVLVVGRDGEAYDPSRWPASRTFRSGDQANLLVADNQTREYERAPERERERLRRATWGAADQPSAGAA